MLIGLFGVGSEAGKPDFSLSHASWGPGLSLSGNSAGVSGLESDQESGKEREVGDQAEGHDRRGKPTEISRNGEFGKTDHRESDSDDHRRGNNGRKDEAERFREGRGYGSAMAREVAETDGDMDRVVHRDAQREAANQDGSCVQWNVEETQNAKDHEERDQVRNDGGHRHRGPSEDCKEDDGNHDESDNQAPDLTVSDLILGSGEFVHDPGGGR